MVFSTLFFDLDDTLYPSKSGLWGAIGDRMTQFMVDRLNIAEEDIPGLRQRYYETYGTSLRGLQIHHQVDSDEFLAYVHDLPLSSYLQPDAALRNLLLSLTQRRWVFTNADSHHANRVLFVLGLQGCFHGIIDIRALDFVCKPDPESYRRAMRLVGETDPEACVFFDDSVRNLAPARSLGIFTVLVGAGHESPHVDRTITSLHELTERMPELWNDQITPENKGSV